MRAQIALWMLTKMGMLFFIIALALILTGLGNIQRADVCASQARFVADSVSGTINSVLSSPVEDERKVLALEPSLSMGRSDFERYRIGVLKVRETGAGAGQSGFFSVAVRTGDTSVEQDVFSIFDSTVGGCAGKSSVPFTGYDEVTLGSDSGDANRVGERGGDEALVLNPSDARAQSRFIVVIKCKQKTFPTRSFLFVYDCTRDEAKYCYGFDTEDVKKNCGFAAG